MRQGRKRAVEGRAWLIMEQMSSSTLGWVHEGWELSSHSPPCIYSQTPGLPAGAGFLWVLPQLERSVSSKPSPYFQMGSPACLLSLPSPLPSPLTFSFSKWDSRRHSQPKGTESASGHSCLDIYKEFVWKSPNLIIFSTSWEVFSYSILTDAF